MRKNAKRFMVKDSGLIVDLVTGRNFTVNATGLLIFRDFLAGEEPAGIEDHLCREFKVSREVARRDLDEFLLDLRVLGIDED